MDEEEIKKVLKRTDKKAPQSGDYLSTGSTILNLACSGKARGGLIKGHYYYLVGDSSSGKTFLSLTCFAEACRNPSFADYRLIYDGPEEGALMDWERFFGAQVAQRVEPPTTKDGEPYYSATIEEFYWHLDDIAEAGKPVIYILDSMDALSTADDLEQVKKTKKASRGEKDTSGSYGTAKAKRNSSGLREALTFLHKSKSILIIISQTRDRIGFGAMFNPRTRSGGRALTFYATLELWTSQAGHIKKKVKEKDRELGIYAEIQIKKNRINGRNRTVTIPIYHSTGIDEVGSCIDYLIEEGHWKKKSGIIDAHDFEFKGNREKLVQYIEQEESERELRSLVAQVWNEIEEACEIKRKRRYD